MGYLIFFQRAFIWCMFSACYGDWCQDWGIGTRLGCSVAQQTPITDPSKRTLTAQRQRLWWPQFRTQFGWGGGRMCCG